MTDLTITHTHMCMSNIVWETDVPGKLGGRWTDYMYHGTYKVRFDEFTHRRRFGVRYDYSCTCKAYIFQKDKYCKHIEDVINEELKCCWHQQFYGGERTKDNKCPKCGNDTVAVEVAV
jgi:hypothetical protein